jgi:hypothetical protein
MVLLIVMIIAIAAGVAGTLAYVEEHRPEREAALLAELEALRSAQVLSIKAWQARQSMAEVAREYEAGGERG